MFCLFVFYFIPNWTAMHFLHLSSFALASMERTQESQEPKESISDVLAAESTPLWLLGTGTVPLSLQGGFCRPFPARTSPF